MKGKFNILTIRNLLPVLGFALLLLISPCKVRNFIQSELGIAQTDVTNKSVTSLSESGCYSLDLSERISHTSNSSAQSSPVAIAKSFSFSEASFHSSCSSFLGVKKQPVTVVPLYILYQNFKAFL